MNKKDEDYKPRKSPIDLTLMPIDNAGVLTTVHNNTMFAISGIVDKYDKDQISKQNALGQLTELIWHDRDNEDITSFKRKIMSRVLDLGIDQPDVIDFRVAMMETVITAAIIC